VLINKIKIMKDYRKWTTDEVALVRAAIKNNAEDMNYLTKSLNRSEGSISCRLGRERMSMGLTPNYTGETIGHVKTEPILV
jgi:hypothetical protein